MKKTSLRAARELSEVVDGIPVSTKRRTLSVIRRLTVLAEDPSLLHVLGSPPAETYDLLAVRPGSEKVFQHACSTLNIDIISLDLSQRIPFYMKYPQVSQVHAILKRVHGTILSYYHTCRQWSEVCILKSAMAQPSEMRLLGEM